jgi:aspartate/methionine/tyrosine aminotransferase
MDQLDQFLLEDFFYQYEHRADLINLASSDASPWSVEDLERLGLHLSVLMAKHTIGYPDVKRLVEPGLKAACCIPDGWSILPTAGAAEGIAVAMHELAARGNCRSIAIPFPSYGAFSGLAKLLGMRVATYSYRQSSNWALDTSELFRCADDCDALVIIDPHNPTGQRVDDATLEDLAHSLTRQKKTLLLDEVFRTYGERDVGADLAEKKCDVVFLGSLSKTYGLPGLRFGWVAAHNDRISRMRTVQQYLTLSLSTGTAVIAADILNRLGDFSRAELIYQNREILVEWAGMNEHFLSISVPQGGTTVAVKFKSMKSETEIFEAFMNHGVLLVPGSKFGASEQAVWFRLGYGTATQALIDGLERVIAAVKLLMAR